MHFPSIREHSIAVNHIKINNFSFLRWNFSCWLASIWFRAASSSAWHFMLLIIVIRVSSSIAQTFQTRSKKNKINNLEYIKHVKPTDMCESNWMYRWLWSVNKQYRQKSLCGLLNYSSRWHESDSERTRCCCWCRLPFAWPWGIPIQCFGCAKFKPKFIYKSQLIELLNGKESSVSGYNDKKERWASCAYRLSQNCWSGTIKFTANWIIFLHTSNVLCFGHVVLLCFRAN